MEKKYLKKVGWLEGFLFEHKYDYDTDLFVRDGINPKLILFITIALIVIIGCASISLK